jgi:citrate lyase subunit beta/citryl-CoA lyase
MSSASWRSLLFVPATSDKFVASAPRRGADAIILDLEDSVAPDRKEEARAALPAHAALLAGLGQTIIVRVNNDPKHLAPDLLAALTPSVSALMLPKIESVNQLAAIEYQIGEAEARAGLRPGKTGTIALIESPRAVFAAPQIAHASSRLVGLGFGSEDFSAAADIAPTRDGLSGPAQWVAMAAAQNGLQAIGLAGSIAGIADLTELRELARFSRRIGLTGSVCIHPDQVAVFNEAFGVSDADFQAAKALCDAFEQALAKGTAAIAFRGRMVDKPVYDRARALCDRYAAQGCV